MRFLVWLAVFCASTAHAAKRAPVAQDAEAKLAAAEHAYEDLDYKRAIQAFTALLDEPNIKVRQRARVLLAFSYYLEKQEQPAKDVLRDLFRENVDYALDREMHHPDLLRFYDTQRNEYVAALDVKALSVPASAPTVQTLGDRKPWLRAIPIVGHFANHDYVGGGIFLGLELAFIGLNVGGAIAVATLRYPEGDFKPAAVSARIIQDIGGVAAIATAVICIVDAFVWSPARGRASLAATPLTLDAGPFGAYRLAFTL